MDRERLHVVFNASAAGTVRQLFRRTGCCDRISVPGDNLMYGPIDDIHGTSRRDWLARHIERDYDASDEDSEPCWTTVLEAGALPVLWIARGDSAERCGFLELVSRLGDKTFEVIDVPPPNTPVGSTPLALGEMTVDQMLSADLTGCRRRMERDEIESDRALWRSLKGENAPLRLLKDFRPVSAPLEAFDDALLAQTTQEWEVCARIVGSAMVGLRDEGVRICDGFLLGRVRALCVSGVLAVRNDDGGLVRSSVRRP